MPIPFKPVARRPAPVEPARAVRSPADRARRLRTIGRAVLVAGVALAVLTYWLETRYDVASLEDLLPGSRAAGKRQMGIMYGSRVVRLWELLQDLKRPGVQAAMIVVAAVLVAIGCFRAASTSE